MIGLRSTALVGDDEWRMKFGMNSHNVSYVQPRPFISNEKGSKCVGDAVECLLSDESPNFLLPSSVHGTTSWVRVYSKF